MNVYDFDKTIYDGDSTIDFYLYCLKRYPYIILLLPKQMAGILRYKCRLIDKTRMKEEFFCFLHLINDIDENVEIFWNLKGEKIKEWYKTQKKKDDLIISASPEFLIKGCCKREKINYLLASRVDKITGKFTGSNCYGEEKVRRFKIEFAGKVIENFYSDSKSDQPMANIALKSWMVKREQIVPWE